MSSIPAKINQKLPISNIVPKKETSEAFEKIADASSTKIIPMLASSVVDLEKIILPSKNRAKPQNTIEETSPRTKSRPFEVSTGIFVKGKKNSGNNVMTKKSDQKEILSKMFECIVFIDYC
ncbi:MAG: hypothetical protein ABIS26_00925 [Candidatus Paceibacterota bacterium]